jgi:hypothetical protein
MATRKTSTRARRSAASISEAAINRLSADFAASPAPLTGEQIDKPESIAGDKPKPRAPKAPQFLLTDTHHETPHRVACVLRYLAALSPSEDGDDNAAGDADFGRFILLQDLALALDHAYANGFGKAEAS